MYVAPSAGEEAPCSAVQCNTTYCNYVLQLTHCGTLQHVRVRVYNCVGYVYGYNAQLTPTHCNVLQLTATHCNSLQLTATHCSRCGRGHHDTLDTRTITHFNTLQLTATHCNLLQHTATGAGEGIQVHWIRVHLYPAPHCNPLQLTATHCISPQHTATGAGEGIQIHWIRVWLYTATHCNFVHLTATYCNSPQHAATGAGEGIQAHWIRVVISGLGALVFSRTATYYNTCCIALHISAPYGHITGRKLLVFPLVATHCNTHCKHCNRHCSTYCNTLQRFSDELSLPCVWREVVSVLQCTAFCCSMLPQEQSDTHTTKNCHCNQLQTMATHCTQLQYIATPFSIAPTLSLRHTATHTTMHCNSR